jgi:hypothetical protein
MSSPRAWLAERAYRLGLIVADWRKTIAGQQSLGAFLRHRMAIKRLLEALGRASPDPPPATFENRSLSGEHYDHWLDGYLDQAASRYAPRPYAGRITLLCSSREPRGWFIDPLLGWSRFASAGIDKAVLEGDHFTVFQGDGLRQMAKSITTAIASR